MKQIGAAIPLVLIAVVVAWLGHREGPEDLVLPIQETLDDGKKAQDVSRGWKPNPAELGDGWEEAFEPELFRPDELYAKIDGGAEVYLANGFRELQVYSFLHPASGEFIELFLFDQGDQAKVMYELEKPPSITEDPDLGGYLSGASLFAVKDSFYVQIQAASESERTKVAVRALGVLIQKEL